MTSKALPDLASTDLCYFAFSSVTLTHTVAQQPQISHCPLCTLVFPIPTYASAHVSLDWNTLPPRPHVQHHLSANVWLKCSFIHKTFLIAQPHKTFLFYKRVVCLSLCVHTFFSLYVYPIFICAQNLSSTLSEGSITAGPTTVMLGKSTREMVLTVHNYRVLLQSTALRVCSQSA